MGTTYFRRFRMEINLKRVALPPADLPDGYHWLEWHRRLNERHAKVKFESFRQEIDAHVFASLGQLDGCRRLMTEIARQSSFLPKTTWLLCFHPDPEMPPTDCGTIQGIARSRSLGAIQNVGIIPEHRGMKLGRALLLQSLDGFRQSGLHRVYLEVTASNTPAVELYRSLGFKLTRTMYRAVSLPDTAGVAF